MEAAIIIVQNSEGKLYVHRRSPNKKRFPNLYGVGAGGKIEEKETPIQAATRELKEELGFESELIFLFSITYEDWIEHVFLTRYEGEITPCKDEFTWSGWMEVKEVDKLANEVKLCPDTQIFYQKFREMKR